jgi:hypothetical protein
MATNWSNVLQQAVTAAENALGQKWQPVAASATHEVTLLTQTAQYIETNKAGMTADEYNSVVGNQKLAMQTVLLGYEDIGIALAEQAVQAAWNVISAALKTATNLPFI